MSGDDRPPGDRSAPLHTPVASGTETLCGPPPADAARPVALAALAAAASLATACADDSSPLNVVPTPPSATEVVGGAVRTGTVAEQLPEPLVVKVIDRYGNRVPGVEVGFAVRAGDGTVRPERDTTGVDGEAAARWVLGTKAGANAVVATVERLDTVAFTATGTPAEPATIERVAGDEQTDTVLVRLPEPIVGRVVDLFGNPIPETEVVWTVSRGAGSLSDSTRTTDADGRVTTVWTLGETAGRQTLRARVANGATTFFAATALPEPPTELVVAGGDAQTGSAGSALVEPLEAKVVDPHGNGVGGISVAWTVLEGGGSADAATVVSDSAGVAAVRYTLGTAQGPERIRADAGDLGDVVFDVEAGEPNDLTIDALYVTQATQSYDGSVALIAGRDGLLRVFVRAAAPNIYRTEVEVRLFQDGVPVRTDTIPPPEDSVATEVDEGTLARSWNVLVPGSLIRPGLGVTARVDLADAVYESDDSDNAFPADGSIATVDVRDPTPFRVRLVPIHIEALAGTGDVDPGNADSYLTAAAKLFPIAGYDADVRAPFSTGVTGTATTDQWGEMLSEMKSLRVADGSGRHYYGIVPAGGGSRICGMASLGNPVALGMDGCGASTAAHEWGHNFGRRHAPCGPVAGPDPDYPYPDASIGVWGYDVETGRLKSPDVYADFMSYCQARWISDYNYDAIIAFRAAEAADAAAVFAAAPEPTLVVWGRIEPDRLILEPAFEATTRPVLPRGDGPYRLEGRAADGGTLFSLSFRGTPVAHGGGDRRDFAFALPARAAAVDRLRSIRLTAPGLPAARIERPAGAADVPADLRVARETADRARLTWNDAAFPMVVVRDPATGEILAFARGGSAVVWTPRAELELTPTPGIGGDATLVPVR